MQPLIFDAHAHYNDEKFFDRDAVLQSLFANGVCGIVEAATDIESAKKALLLSEQYEKVYAAVGIYPHETHLAPQDACAQLAKLLSHPKAVALGEIGLDYYYDDSPRETQLEWLDAQMELAAQCDKPVVIHDREAHGDCIDAVRRHPHTRGMFHSFSASAEIANELVKRGWYISFSGSVTFKNAVNLQRAASVVPLSQMLLETDSPYLAPVPKRGTRNQSDNILYTASVIAQLHNTSVEEVLQKTCENAHTFFGI